MSKIKILQGNCIDKIKELDDNSIDCVVSSPPYFGLRDYGTASYENGDDNCKHTITDGVVDNKNNKLIERPKRESDKKHCVKCGAKRIDEQFGLEKTYQDYLANTVKVFETFKPKLKDTATIWWNVGDSYNNKPAGNKDLKRSSGLPNKKENLHKRKDNISKVLLKSLKEKDLIMIPNRVAIALQDAGWYIRSEIVWHKPNAMPESVRDRPTSCHEKIWLITKSKKYYYDSDAIKEPCTKNTKKKYESGWNSNEERDYVNGKQNHFSKYISTEKSKTDALKGRNKRNVWTITTKPFKGSHFATFPKDLIEPCIKAGCPEGGVVLDPFGGSGTTGIVSALNNRNAILIELNQKYIDIVNKRIDKELGLFNK